MLYATNASLAGALAQKTCGETAAWLILQRVRQGNPNGLADEEELPLRGVAKGVRIEHYRIISTSSTHALYKDTIRDAIRPKANQIIPPSKCPLSDKPASSRGTVAL